MPLSDEEARLLHQLEQSLAAEDPDFASTLRGSKLLAKSKRLAVLSALGFVAGLGVLFAGVVLAITWLGIVGFVFMPFFCARSSKPRRENRTRAQASGRSLIPTARARANMCI